MAPKRASPLEDPPSASSSEEESEEINDGKEGQKHEQNIQNVESEEEEEEESEDEEEEEEEDQRENKKHSVQSPLNLLRRRSQSCRTPKAEGEQKGKESQKKKSKVSNGDEEEGAVEEKKSAITRLWSEDDEIAVLKGLIEYQSKKGADPHADMGAFHDFIKKSLHVDVTKSQLVDKIRRLKKKYQNNVEKGEKGEDPVFSKPHEHKSFELSKKIWGRGAGNAVENNSNAKTKSNNISKAKKSVEANNSTHLPKEGRPELSLGEGSKAEGKDLKVEQEDFWSIHPRLFQSLELEKFPYLSMPEVGKNFIKESMILIGSRKTKELEEKWKDLCMDEIALYLKRVELIQEQAKLVLDAMKASKS
ncbi:unnamed protein product [Thlaspi arvense]|uniref:Glabrous enhancer-binding protein-like DBD domain-containing protein n=1 Tax=Thlaspi arvense TaxID=13288 RepID=A0AAU9S717_THLAR|nr:unnamed protein product [Thlaspi arvense]